MSGVALITGAASGIGLATARAFAPRVQALVLSDLSERRLTPLAAALRSEFSVDVLPFVGNMGDETDIVRMHEEAKRAFGRVDYAVNNAGTATIGKIAQYKTADWDKVTGVNERGVFLCMREQLAIMEGQEPLPLPAHITGATSSPDGGTTRANRAQRGSIINISSVLGFAGIEGNAAYVSSKHALVGLAKAAAIEYGGLGVRINNVAPGFIATPLTTSPQAIQLLRAATTKEKTPMARAGLPEEVADVIVFLSSPEASFVNGATWTVDGGYLAL